MPFELSPLAQDPHTEENRISLPPTSHLPSSGASHSPPTATPTFEMELAGAVENWDRWDFGSRFRVRSGKMGEGGVREWEGGLSSRVG